jgi:hypothetical protein
MTQHSPTRWSSRPVPTFVSFLIIFGTLAYVLFLWISALRSEPEFTCTTDWECSQTPECLAEPGCDGGPEPTQPYTVVQ